MTDGRGNGRLSRADLRVRTLRMATGTYFLSFVTGFDAPSLADVLDDLPPSSEVVVNLDGLGPGDARRAVEASKEARRRVVDAGLTIIVCGDAATRRSFELSDLDWYVILEQTLDDAFRYVFRQAWLARWVGADRSVQPAPVATQSPATGGERAREAQR